MTQDTCACGCGRALPPVQPRYLPGHYVRTRLGHVVEDRGYVTPCWIEQGRSEKGYVIRSRSTNGVVTKRGAHVISWEKANGRPVPAGMQVHHLCSQPRCSNPDHLDLRTPGANVRESRAAKLTIEQVREIRASPLPATELAKRMPVSAYSIRKVRKGETWRGAE